MLLFLLRGRPISLKPCLMVSIQFCLGVTNLHFVVFISQCETCLVVSEVHTIVHLCLNHLSTLSMIIHNFYSNVFSLTTSFHILSFQAMPGISNLWCAASKFFFHVTHRDHAAARLVTGARRRDHITPILRQLHWLPVHQRVTFKIAVLVFQCLAGQAPAYLADDCRLTSHRPTQRCASSDVQITVSATGVLRLLDHACDTAVRQSRTVRTVAEDPSVRCLTAALCDALVRSAV